MNNFIDEFSGTYVGKLHVTRVAVQGGPGRHAYYECECPCGNVVRVRSTSLKRAAPDRTCGHCLKFITGSAASAKALYMVWHAMKYRCYEVTMFESDSLYFRYRDRGIRVYRKWIDDVTEFAKWAMANGWKRGLEIDRRDNDKHYTPKNCHFVDRKTNTNNRECTPMVSYMGAPPRPFSDVVRDYAVVSHGTAWQRHFRMEWPLHEALTTPARVGNYS